MHRVNHRNFASVEDYIRHRDANPDRPISVTSEQKATTWIACSFCGSAVRVPVAQLKGGRDDV
jgi:hypothetical protein